MEKRTNFTMLRKHALLVQIDQENTQWHGPIRIPRMAPAQLFMDILDRRRRNHPLYRSYIRALALDRFIAMIRIMLFWKRTARAFLEEYYAPGGGGFLKGKRRFETLQEGQKE